MVWKAVRGNRWTQAGLEGRAKGVAETTLREEQSHLYHTMRVSQFVAVLIAVSTACEAGPEPAVQTVEVRDSAGIPVVINPPPASDTAPPLRLPSEPLISIGSDRGGAEYRLFDVQGGALLGGGHVVLANAGTHEVRLYDSAGIHLRSVGGEGSGPGEFRLLGWGGTFRGDLIMAVDGLLRRATIFDSSGSYVRSFILPDQVTRPLAEPLGVLSDGGILYAPTIRDSVAPRARWAETGTERRQRQPVVVWPAGRVDSVGGLRPGEEWYRDAEKRSMLRVPLGRSLHGSAVGSRIALANDDSFRVHVYDQSYRVSTVIIEDVREREVTDADYWTAAEAQILGDLTMPSARASARETLEELPRRSTWPRFLDLRLDRDGGLWVKESVEQREGELWSVFDPRGRLAFRLQVPERFLLLDIREDKLLGLRTDTLGVQRAEVYRLTARNPMEK